MRMGLGAVVVGLAIAAAAPATADPAPPDPALIVPAPVAEAPAPLSDTAPPPSGDAAAPSSAQQTKSNPVGTLTDLLRGAAAAESADPAVQQSVSATNPLASVSLLMPQNFGMPTGDQPSPYALGENAPSGFARVDAYQGVHALLHGALGRMPGSELGQPLAGTAPPPGTAVPPGLVQYFDPAAGATPPGGAAAPAGGVEPAPAADPANQASPPPPPPVDPLLLGPVPN